MLPIAEAGRISKGILLWFTGFVYFGVTRRLCRPKSYSLPNTNTMRLPYLLACCSLFLLLSIQPAHAVVHIKPETKVEKGVEETTALNKKELKQKKRQQRKQFKKQLKAKLKQLRQESDTDLLLLVIIAVVVIAGVAFLVIRSRRRGGEALEEDEPAEGEEPMEEPEEPEEPAEDEK